jgi:queuine tRNA-ribosyltransferase
MREIPNSKPNYPAHGAYRIHIAREGFASILHVASGEIMHSRTPPMEEARRLYIEQSRLAERLRPAETGRPLVLWDVGLGAAANAMAAIRCYEEQAAAGPVRPLQVVSFENDLDSLRLAVEFRDLFPYLHHEAPAELLREGRWESRQHPGLSWILVPGDFQQSMSLAPEPPEVIFYDLFSGRTNGDQWTLAAFRRLFAACGNHPTELFTYTVSTASRAALLVAGFWVARGRGTGAKGETTIALTPAARNTPFGRRHELLGPEWLGKWRRSAARIPSWLGAHEREEFEKAVLEHAQFRAASA